jgi:hypothetical protein
MRCTPTPDPSPQGGGEQKFLLIRCHMSDFIKRKPRFRLLARDSYASSWQHVAVLAVVAITALIAIVPFVFAIIHAGP